MESRDPARCTATSRGGRHPRHRFVASSDTQATDTGTTHGVDTTKTTAGAPPGSSKEKPAAQTAARDPAAVLHRLPPASRSDVARECVAGFELPGVEAASRATGSAARPSRGSSSRDRSGPGPAPGSGRRRPPRRRQALVEIAVLEDSAVIGGSPPDAGEAVSLELEPDRELVGVVGVLLALRSNLRPRSRAVAGGGGRSRGRSRTPGRSPRAPEAPIELVEEAEVDVDLLVERAIEGPVAELACPQPELTASRKRTSLARW